MKLKLVLVLRFSRFNSPHHSVGSPVIPIYSTSLQINEALNVYAIKALGFTI